ncbi:MAG TPA: CbiX/SirB N-terminal domain-containing protein [Pirellulaceae bacterium]|nr:CbiX/SirB N-terminal domain-containing protein [Pirellulaceae bacterium]
MDVSGTPESGSVRRGLLLVGHGTRYRLGQDEFLATVRQIAERLPDWLVQPGFLELAEPTLDEAVERLVEAGATDCVVTPLLLFAAGHAKRDVPELIESARQRYPHVNFRQAGHLGCEPRLLALSLRRFRDARRLIGDLGELADLHEAGGIPAAGIPAAGDGGELGSRVETAAGGQIAPAPQDSPSLRQQVEYGDGTLLILVGRGSLDAEATAEMNRYAALCGEQAGATTVRVGFVAMARPTVDEVLAEAVETTRSVVGPNATGGIRRVVVQPHFLFAGELLETVRRKAMAAASAGGGEWYWAEHLGPAAELAEAVIARTVDIASST